MDIQSKKIEVISLYISFYTKNISGSYSRASYRFHCILIILLFICNIYQILVDICRLDLTRYQPLQLQHFVYLLLNPLFANINICLPR